MPPVVFIDPMWGHENRKFITIISMYLSCHFRTHVRMSFEFTIPVARDDLLNRTGVDQYVVDEVLTLREIAGTLQGNYW